MTAGAEQGTFMQRGVTFEKAAKKFRPKEANVLAIQHKGPSAGYPTKDGIEIADDGDYVVKVGTVTRQRTVPPATSASGVRTPGYVEDVQEPLLQVVKRQDFEDLYVPA